MFGVGVLGAIKGALAIASAVSVGMDATERVSELSTAVGGSKRAAVQRSVMTIFGVAGKDISVEQYQEIEAAVGDLIDVMVRIKHATGEFGPHVPSQKNRAQALRSRG